MVVGLDNAYLKPIHITKCDYRLWKVFYFAEIAKGGLIFRGSFEAGKKLLEECIQMKQLSEPHFALKHPQPLNAQWIEPEITLHVSHGLESSYRPWREPARVGD